MTGARLAGATSLPGGYEAGWKHIPDIFRTAAEGDTAKATPATTRNDPPN